MQEKHTIVWSGGFDSTALLLSIIIQSNGNNIMYDVVSFNSDRVACSENDKKARILIKGYLSKLDCFKKFNFFEIDIPSNDTYGCDGQADLWMRQSIMRLSFNNKNYLYFGYIRSDDFYHDKSKFVDMIKKHSENNVAVFPFEWAYKHEIISYYSLFRGLFELISWSGDDEEVKLKHKHDLRERLDLIFSAVEIYNCNKELRDDYSNKSSILSLEKFDLIEPQLNFNFL